MSISFRSMDPAQVPGGVYHLLNAAIAPRPIAWIATLAEDGTLNIAPHSYTMVASPNPPMVAFTSVGWKDTVRNVQATGEFVYHIGDVSLAEQINLSAADFPPNVSEFDWAGLTRVPSDRIRVPRALEAPVAMEAKLVDVVKVGSTANWIVIGEVVRFHIADRVFAGDRIDPKLLQPIGRLAGSQYATLGDLFSIQRPTFSELSAGDARSG